MNAAPAVQPSGEGLRDRIPAPPAPDLRRIPLDELHESPHNPRRRFDSLALAQLMDSMLASGQLEPVLVRPRAAGGYELAAGHRRLRAARLACAEHADGARYRGLQELLALVREMDDRTLIETLNVDNLQRDDLHALEEAEGFRDLMTACGYDVKKIAARIGHSARYVYDSLTLLKLVPQAQQLFLAGRFERGHAIELARLGPEEQRRVLGDPEDEYLDGGVFTRERDLFGQYEMVEVDDKRDPLAGRKPVSVRELQDYIAKHVRFDPAGEHVPELFPETAAELEEAETFVPIAYERNVSPDAKPEKGRVYGPEHWKRADGAIDPWTEEGSTVCAHAISGYVIAGPQRGQAFKICTAKKKCDVHWKKERQEAERRAKAAARGDFDVHGSASSRAKSVDDWREQQAERKRWKRAGPALLKAVIAKLKSAPTGPDTPLGKLLIGRVMPYWGVPGRTAMSPGQGGDALVRYLGFLVLGGLLRSSYRGPEDLPKVLKPFGIDAREIVNEVAPKPKPPAKGRPVKKAARRKGASR